MALPTISNNSPSAGSISWTAFGIQYNGQSFNIPAGSSSKKFVWWLYGGGTAPALVDGDTVPSLGNDDMILFLNKGGVGVLVPTADLTDGSLIVNGSILAPAIAANEIQSYHLSANSVTANAIAANSVTSQDIQAGAITTDKLAVGTVTDSLVTNGSFEEFDATGMPLGWRSIAQTNGTLAIVTGIASSGVNALRLQTTVAASNNVRIEQTPEKFIPVSATAGRKWYVSMRYGAGTATTNGAYLRVTWYDAAKVSVGTADVIANAALPTTFTIAEGQVTPPSTARYMGISILLVNSNVATSMYVDEVIAREVIVSAIIQDGAITTPKMTANSINANVIAGGTITADKLLISDFQNYVRDPGLEAGGIGWSLPTGGSIATITDPRVDGTKVMQIVGGGTVRDATTAAMPVRAGEWYYASCYIRKTVAGTGAGTLQLGATIDTTITGQAASYQWPSFKSFAPSQLALNTWTLMEGVVQMPANARLFQLRPSVRQDVVDGTFQFDDFVLRRMNGGELIVDGTITALELATDSVTSDKVQANAIIAGKIAANAVVANSIASNSVLSNHIMANNVLASHIVANAIQANHIQAGAIDGQVITGGELRTTQGAGQIAARMGPSTTFDPTGNTVRPGIGFTVAGNTDNPAGMFSPTGTDLQLVQGGAGTAGNLAYMSLGSNNAKLYGWNTTTVTGRSGVTIDGQVGSATIAGNQVNLQHTNGLLVNGKDVTQASVQSWIGSGTGLINAYVSRVSPLTADAPNSTDTTIGTLNLGNSVKITSTGVYDITVGLGLDAGVTNRSFLEIITPNGGPHRAYFGPGEDTVSVTATGVVLAANDIIYANIYQQTGGTRNYNARFRITKVAAPVQLNSTNTQWQSGSVNLAGDLTVTGNVNILKPVTGAHWSTQSGPSSTFYSDQIPAGTLWGPGKPPAGSDSSDPNLISWPANDTIQFRDAGVYSLSVQCRLSSGVTAPSGNQTFVSFEPTTNNAQNPAYAKGIMPYSDNQMSASVANVRMAAGQQIKLYIVQYTGATIGMWWRINVTRIG